MEDELDTLQRSADQASSQGSSPQQQMKNPSQYQLERSYTSLTLRIVSLSRFETHQPRGYYFIPLICNYSNNITNQAEKEIEEFKFTQYILLRKSSKGVWMNTFVLKFRPKGRKNCSVTAKEAYKFKEQTNKQNPPNIATSGFPSQTRRIKQMMYL